RRRIGPVVAPAVDDDPVVLRQRRDLPRPLAVVGDRAMDEQHRRAASFVHVMERQAVCPDLALARVHPGRCEKAAARSARLKSQSTPIAEWYVYGRRRRGLREVQRAKPWAGGWLSLRLQRSAPGGSDSPAVLRLGACRMTRYVRFAHCAQTD